MLVLRPRAMSPPPNPKVLSSDRFDALVLGYAVAGFLWKPSLPGSAIYPSPLPARLVDRNPDYRRSIG